MPLKGSINVLDEFLAPNDTITVYHEVKYGQPVHTFDMHYALECGIMLSGRARRLCGDWSAEIGAGEVWFHGVWEPHGVELVEGPAGVLVFAVNPQALATIGAEQFAEYDWMAPFAAAPGLRPQASPRVREQLLTLAADMTPRIAAGDDQSRLWAWFCLLQMMLLVRAEWTPPSARAAVRSADSYLLLDRAVELVLSTRHPVSLGQAARVCGLNPNTFNRLFKELMGITFARYGLRYRLSGGATQLARSMDTVQAIAKEWGFADASHFHRCFQAQYSCTPAEYRSRRQGQMEDTA